MDESAELASKAALRKNVWKFYLSTFFGSWSFATGFLVFYYRELGFSFFQIFLLAVIYEVLNFLLEIPTGVLADLWSRKRVIVIGYLISGLSFFMVLIRPDAYATYVIWAILSAVCTTLNSGSVDAFIYDSVQEIDPTYYPKVLGRIFALSLITQAASFPLGGWLSDNFGFRYALLFSGIGGLLQTLVIATTFEIPLKRKENKFQIQSLEFLKKEFIQQISGSFVILFKQVQVRSILMYSILFFVMSEFARVISQPYLSSLGYNTKSVISVFSAGFLVITAISSIILGQIQNQRNDASLLLVISAGLSIPFIFLNFSTIGIPAFVVFYIALGAGQVVVPAIMNQLIPSDKRATILSAQNQIGSISYAIAASIIGFSIDRLGINNSAMIVGITAALLFASLLAKVNSRTQYDNPSKG